MDAPHTQEPNPRERGGAREKHGTCTSTWGWGKAVIDRKDSIAHAHAAKYQVRGGIRERMDIRGGVGRTVPLPSVATSEVGS